MVLFGLWHKATLLFVLWGLYHGVLLVSHRQIQKIQRKLDWEPLSISWAALSWLVTISLISLGWIFFRANSPGEAEQMLSAVLSPKSYLSHRVSGSLYGLVLALAVGYAIVLWAIAVLDHHSAQAELMASRSSTGFVALLARRRWLWIPPLYALALMIVLMVTLTQGASTAQFMYRTF
jgi:alginate O-acetyltransferase complex protein AlgI